MENEKFGSCGVFLVLYYFVVVLLTEVHYHHRSAVCELHVIVIASEVSKKSAYSIDFYALCDTYTCLSAAM